MYTLQRITSLRTALLFLLMFGFSFAGAETATLNLKDADIRVLIDTVSEVTGKNFVIDPRVKAKVTVVSSKPMNQDELYGVFLSILQVHGFAAIPTDDIIKIVPDVSAKQGPVPTASYKNPGRGDQLVTRVIAVENVPAAQLVPILRPLIPQQGQLAAYQPSNTLIVSDRAANVNRLVSIIKRIDRPDQDEIEIIRLDNAPANDVARTLSTLMRQTAQGAATVPGAPMVTADERTNSILISGDKASRLRIRGLIANLDTPLDTGGDTQVVFLKYARAEELVEILTGVSKTSAVTSKAAPPGTKPVPQRGGASSSNRGSDIDIRADEGNNALVITAPPAVQQELKRVIAQLDIRRAQVLIEAIIAEVRLDLAKELGASLAVFGQNNNDDNFTPAVVTNLGGLTDLVLQAVSGTLTSVPAGITIGGADMREGRTNFGLLLKALAGDAATNILSTPTIVTLDNEEAELIIAQNVPFLTGSFTNTGAAEGAVNPFQTIERKDVGLTLRVKPQINEGTAVKLEIEQESSSLSGSSTGVDIVTNNRSIKTTVLAEDGQVIVLGGLMDDTFNDTEQKVPFLGDIPILGHLFKSTSTNKVKTSLMVFMRPVIMRDASTADAYTRQKYSVMQARQLDAGLGKRGLIRDSAAKLPDLDELITQLPESGADFLTQMPAAPVEQTDVTP